MKRKTSRFCAALALLAPMIAQGAGFDCHKASSVVEKAICASPSLSKLDEQLGAAFNAALTKHVDKATALRIDQQHWLAERDDRAWAFARAGEEKDMEQTVATAYRQRLQFLAGLDAPKAPKPFDTLQPTLASLPLSPSDDPLEAMAKARPSIVLANERLPGSAKDFRLQAEPALQKAMADLGDHIIDRDFHGSPISSMYSVDGTASCITELPYRIDGNKASRIDPPPVWGSGDCMVQHRLAMIDGSVFAFRMTYDDASDFMVSSSRWNGARFEPAVALDIRFDRMLSLSGSACAPKQSPCDAFGEVALAAASRYTRRPVPGTLDRPLEGDHKAAYESALALARAKGGIATRDEYHDPVELPQFGQKVRSDGMTAYGAEATTFPIDFHGETLLGFIGHGHVGWRADGHWLVSAWRAKDGKLEPVASAYVAVKRGPLLLSSVVPASPAETH